MTNRNRICLAAVAALAAVLAAVLVPTAAQAEDQRPCVSKREFYGARDFGIPHDADPMTKVPPPDVDALGRIDLEGRWDVRHLGVTVTTLRGSDPTLNGSQLGEARNVAVKMYRSCEVPLSVGQIYVGYNERTNLVLWTLYWPQRLTDQLL